MMLRGQTAMAAAAARRCKQSCGKTSGKNGGGNAASGENCADGHGDVLVVGHRAHDHEGLAPRLPWGVAETLRRPVSPGVFLVALAAMPARPVAQPSCLVVLPGLLIVTAALARAAGAGDEVVACVASVSRAVAAD